MVEKLIGEGVPQRQACRVLGFARSSLRYEPEAGPADGPIRRRIRDLSGKHKRYGYRRITALLRREGEPINHKRVFRLWREEKLCLPRRRPRKRRYLALWERPAAAHRPNEVWSYDFIFDWTVTGAVLKMLVVLDEYTRECLRIRVNGSQMNAERVLEVLEGLIRERGASRYVRSDNGPEFIAGRLQEWFSAHGIRPVYSEPGEPWQNGYVESFNGKFRDECLNMELFWNEREAQVLVEQWRREYNERRPHSALGYATPTEAAMGRRRIFKISLS